MWIKRIDDGDLINIKDCVYIKKGINYLYDHKGDPDHIKNYYIYFEWQKGGRKIIFDKEEQRDNFYEHLEDYMSLVVIDPNVKPLKL